MNLNNLAETSGIGEAAERLRQSDFNPDEVAALCKEYRAELDQIKNEITRQVSGQVHDSGFASSMLSKAVLEMDGVLTSLTNISQRCDQMKETTAGFDNLRRATIAKRNIHSVMEQLDLYARVPTRVKRLLSELERNQRGENLRRVFREWLGLSAWRDRVIGHVEDEATRAAQAEERAWRRARGEVLENDDTTLAENDAKAPSSASFETMLALLKDHFRDTFVLGDRLFEILMGSISDIFDICKERPQDLVLCAEMCERTDRQVSRERKKRGMLSSSIKNNTARDDVSKRKQFLTKLGEFADERAGNVLKQSADVTTKKPSSERARFEDVMVATDALLTDLQVIARDARSCLPRYYDILGLFRKWYEARITRELSERIHDSVTETELPSYEMLAMASWIANYCSAVHSFYEGVEDTPGAFPRDVVGLERLCDNLVDRYLTERALPRIAHECRVKVEEIGLTFVKVDVTEVLVGDHGYIRTDLPMAIFDVLTREMHVCNRHFAGERALKVFQEFITFSTTWFLPEHEKRLKNAESIEDDSHVERICAWLTDAYKFQTLIRDLFDIGAEGFMRCEDVAEVIGKASDIVDSACNLFSDSALRFAREDIVEKRILADVEAQVIPNLFTKEWEESRYLGARVITATLEDWFFHNTNGLREWVANDFCLARALLLCLEGVVKLYANGLLKWSKRFGSAKRAAGRVEEDAKALGLFFKRNITLLKMAESASCRTEDDVDKKFRVLRLMADIIQGDEFNLDPLVELLGTSHATKVVILRLRALRGGRVFNRREADLEKDLAQDDNVPSNASSIVDVDAIAKLGLEVGDFDGEVVATNFAETSPVSTDRQIAFVKKMSAFARSASFSQNGKTATRPGPAGATKTTVSGAKKEETNVLTMNEFISTKKT